MQAERLHQLLPEVPPGEGGQHVAADTRPATTGPARLCHHPPPVPDERVLPAAGERVAQRVAVVQLRLRPPPGRPHRPAARLRGQRQLGPGRQRALLPHKRLPGRERAREVAVGHQHARDHQEVHPGPPGGAAGGEDDAGSGGTFGENIRFRVGALHPPPAQLRRSGDGGPYDVTVERKPVVGRHNRPSAGFGRFGGQGFCRGESWD